MCRASLPVAQRCGAMNLQSHADILQRGEALVQVMGLEDEAKPPPTSDEGILVRPGQFCPKELDATLLDLSQAADQSEQRGLSGARCAEQHRELAARDLDVDVEEGLLPCLSSAEPMVQPRDDNG